MIEVLPVFSGRWNIQDGLWNTPMLISVLAERYTMPLPKPKVYSQTILVILYDTCIDFIKKIQQSQKPLPAFDVVMACYCSTLRQEWIINGERCFLTGCHFQEKELVCYTVLQGAKKNSLSSTTLSWEAVFACKIAFPSDKRWVELLQSVRRDEGWLEKLSRDRADRFLASEQIG